MSSPVFLSINMQEMFLVLKFILLHWPWKGFGTVSVFVDITVFQDTKVKIQLKGGSKA